MSLNKLVVGCMGMKKSGKSQFLEFVKEQAAEAITVIKSSDLINSDLDRYGIPRTRENQQDWAIILNKRFGDGRITHLVKQQIDRATTPFIIFDGVRLTTDILMIREFPLHLFVHISAPVEMRFQRDQESPEPQFGTIDAFVVNDRKETERMIIDYAKLVNATWIDNSFGLQHLGTSAFDFFYEKMLPHGPMNASYRAAQY